MTDWHPLQKGVEKHKFSLSLKQRHDENVNPVSISARTVRNPTNKINSIKRPLQDTNSGILLLAKRFKSGIVKSSKTEYELVVEPPADWSKTQAMLNGHHTGEKGPPKHAPIATLTNLGNTCFLNSVLYTLRYAPRFLHNLHHLVWDLAIVDQKLGSLRLKSSSLGRGNSLVSATTRSWSTKDLLALPNTDNAAKSKIQIVTERLHETYVSLRGGEARCSGVGGDTPEPYAADSFLSALREVNSTFEGNRQQDAHELLVCILDNIRETCAQLRAKVTRLQAQENGDSNGIGKSASIEPESKNALASLGKSWKKKMLTKSVNAESASPIEEKMPKVPGAVEDVRTKPGFDFVSEDFEGMMVLRTTCLECETVTERKQAMCDVCVPVAEQPPEQHDESELFRAAAVTSEYLRDQNKYWCERCLRYNEARRTVGYETLPRLLVMQLKRFSGGMEKITRHAPTPLQLSCFCESCSRRPRDLRPHSYKLWAIIMHLGAALSGGHYVALVRAGMEPAVTCERASTEPAPPGGFVRTLFSRQRAQQGCSAAECCRVRAQQESTWLHCDDDTVKPLTQTELEELLAPEPAPRSAATPYLLFYLKSDAAAEVG